MHLLDVVMIVHPSLYVRGAILRSLFLLRLFMQELLREIILQPNYTVIMEMRGSCLETQTQNDDETVCVRVLVCACLCVCSCRARWRCQINLYLRRVNKLLIFTDQLTRGPWLLLLLLLLLVPHLLSCLLLLFFTHVVLAIFYFYFGQTPLVLL